MYMHVGVGYCDNPDSAIAAKKAAKQAIQNAKREDACSLVLLFSTARHNQKTLRDEVANIVGKECPIYGGGAVGVITNDDFGYAGDQVGVACLWFEKAECNVVMQGELIKGEIEAGEQLGKKLASIGVKPDSPVMLFYDAINQTTDPMQLVMATWILEGLEKGLGFFPDLTGAGLQGDHICTPTEQYLGDKISGHSAFALAFSDDIRIDNAIMHGCRPASPYYTVTKAQGPVILEINDRPAIEFIDEVLHSAIKPEEYPFFLLFGVNHSEQWGEFDEDHYASRLCLGIDKEHNGIVMFEPDMVAGTKFQLMFRSIELDYMKPQIEALFAKIEDREPIFAVYIDCAGRCAGYGGIDMEDAYIIQEAMNEKKIPLLGLYTGVEIASIGGKPRGLDWTGVLCIFSKSKNNDASKITASGVEKVIASQQKNSDAEAQLSADEVKKMAEQNIAKVLSLDTQSIAIRYELEQKRRGFALLAELAVSLRRGSGNENIFLMATQRINAALNMQKTVVLIPDEQGNFMPSIMQGYTPEERIALGGKAITLDAEFLDMEKPVLVTGADNSTRFAELRKTLNLPLFISMPVVMENKIAAILITGRMMEAPPFLSRLGRNDVETMQAIVALLASVLVYQRLDDANKLAQTDVLTGLANRRALEINAAEMLEEEMPYGKVHAFVMADIDYFKQVNDKHGHIVGDETLRALASLLRANFRATDVVARLGGDEFAIFCTLTGGTDPLKDKMERLINLWQHTPIKTEEGDTFTSTLSIGVSLAPRDSIVYEELLHKADIALYKSKENGRNQYTIYDARIM